MAHTDSAAPTVEDVVGDSSVLPFGPVAPIVSGRSYPNRDWILPGSDRLGVDSRFGEELRNTPTTITA